LRERVSAIVEEFQRLTGQLATLEEASEKTAEELRAAKNAADATLVENRTLQEQLKRMKVEKEEIVSALGSARRRLGESERALAYVQVRGDRVWKGLRMLTESASKLASVRDVAGSFRDFWTPA
jgi:chromosome segregation ATPase